MPAVDPLFAQWLMSDADHVVRSVAAPLTWGATAIVAERVTGIATLAGAAAEADRQLGFWSAGPYAIEVHRLIGLDWEKERGQIVTLTIDQLGYDAGIDVFVIEVETDRTIGVSEVAVLRSMKGA